MPKSDMVKELIATYGQGRKLPGVAKDAGINYDRLRNIVSGRVKNISEAELRKIASAVGAPGEVEDFPKIVRSPLKAVKVVGAASMGEGEDIHPEEYELYVPASMVTDSSCAWEAVGDSMSPWVMPGDVVIVKPHKVPRVGYPMLARKQDGSVVLKMVAFEEGGYVLKPLNPAYKTEPGEVEYIGYMTGRYRSVAGYELIESELSGLRPILQ